MATTEAPCESGFSEAAHGAESDVGVADELTVLEAAKVKATMGFVERCTSARAVYIGKRTAEGSISIVAATDPALVGQMLADDRDDEGKPKSLPFAVFEPEEENETEGKEEEAVEDGQGAETDQASPPKLPAFVHASNVLRDDRVPFFGRVPLLGSFVAVHVPYTCSIHSDAIPEDGGLIEVEAQDTAQGSEEEKQDGETGDGSGEATEDAEASPSSKSDEKEGQEASSEPAERKWLANTVDASLVICFDTIGADVFVDGVADDEVDFVRRLARGLGGALSASEGEKYQAEMRLRDTLTELAESSKEALAKGIQEIQGTDEAAAEAAGEEKEVLESEQDDKDVLEEETAFKEAVRKLEAHKTHVGAAPWWLAQFRAQRKQCIAPPERVQSGAALCLRVFVRERLADWAAIKAADIDALAASVASFDPEKITTTEEEGNGQEAELEKALGLLADVAEVGTDENDPAWLTALLTLAGTSLEAVACKVRLDAKLQQIREEKAAEEKAAADSEAAEAQDADEATP